MIKRLAAAALLLVGSASVASATVIDFEGLADSTAITNQYLGVVFTNTVVLTAGISLNEFEFPPHSGVNVAFDAGGPITLQFAPAVTDFSAYFTYTTQLNLSAIDTLSNTLTAASLFSTNFVSSGHPPNELISFADPAGIKSITITGDPGGSSFVMDDLSFTPLAQLTTPEPSGLAGLGAVLLLAVSVQAAALRRRAALRRKAEASV